jgi:hypothetical protein
MEGKTSKRFGEHKVEVSVEDVLTPVLKKKKQIKKPTVPSWYSPNTIETLKKEIEEVSKDFVEKTIAIIGNPAIYFSLNEETQSKVIIFSVNFLI